MKKTILATVFTSAVLASSAAVAEGWRVLPILSDKTMKFEPTLALTLNRVDPDQSNFNSVTAYGLDLNFNCGLIQDPLNRMRTHFNVSRSDKQGLEVLAFELSPRYTVPLGNGLSIGVGPSLAVFELDAPGFSESYFGIGVAAGVNYRVNQFYAGADLRIHDTRSDRGVNYDNVALGAKVGINF